VFGSGSPAAGFNFPSRHETDRVAVSRLAWE
jgi:hypothetical protein